MADIPRSGSIIKIAAPDEDPRFFVVTSSEPDRLFLRDASDHRNQPVLVVENGQWKVDGSSIPYNIEILESVLLTEQPEIDMKILLQVNDDVLPAICETNSYTRSLCLDDY